MEPQGVLSEPNLARIYGQEKARQILRWIEEFRQYECNFPTITPNIHEANGRPLLLLSCPVLFRREDGEYRLTIGIGFTQQFPERPPHCAVLLSPGERLRSDHPVVAPNGSIRLVQLPALSNEPRPSLCTILLAVIDAFEADFPLDTAHAVAAGATGGAPPAGAGSDPCTPSSSSSPGVDSHLLQEAQERVLIELRKKGDEYLQLREAALKQMHHLEASKVALNALEDTLAQKKRQLLEIKPDIANLHGMIAQWKSSDEVDDTNACLVPENALHGQAMDLLADVQTADDMLELLDGCLGKGILTCDEYLKRLSAVARRQFMSKYLLKKATGQIAAAANVASLTRRFPMFDEAMIREVLLSTGYDVGQAAAKLTQMSA